MIVSSVFHSLPMPVKRLARAMLRSITNAAEAASCRSTAARSSHPSALPCVLASNEFGSYCVPRASLRRPAAQAILRGKVWEPETIAFMRENCGGGDIIHAGTYFGDFLPGLSAAMGAGALIWAFEPNEENYRCASITIELNALCHRVKLTHAALGPENGTVMLSVLDASDYPLGGKSRIDGSGTERVTQIALDGLIPHDRHVSIIQLDVEGYEEKALRGSEQLVRRDRPVLILETVPASDWFNELLKDCGYTFKQTVADNSVFVAVSNRLAGY